MKIVILGGGAAGFFAAISAKQKNRQAEVVLLEKSAKLLSKVKISGGGRCNVTHHLFQPKEFIKNYPRGSKELLSAFCRFSSKDTVDFFTNRGILLKTEEDNRMFPASDSSDEIINCLVEQAKELGVSIYLRSGVDSIQKESNRFLLKTKEGEILADKLLIATGSSKSGYELAQSMGHTIEPLIPSLFALNIENFPYKDLSGISCENASVSFKKKKLLQTGPLLITHFGLSGPCALKLSAFGAKEFYHANYEIDVVVNWISKGEKEAEASLLKEKTSHPKAAISNTRVFDLPKNLWIKLLERAEIDPQMKTKDIQEKKLRRLSQLLTSDLLQVKGKTTNKSEFVTCGGVRLSEIDFKTMESRICKNLFFAGEVMDVDGITGGFNFQNAWTTGYIAGVSMAGAGENV